MSAAFLLLVTLLGDQEPASPSRLAPRSVRVDEVVPDALSREDPEVPDLGPVRPFAFVADAAGSVTISVVSFDFDAFLRVETEEGEAVEEDDDAGVETNPWLVLDARKGTPYRVLVAATDERGGEFTISFSAGGISPPSGARLIEESITFRIRAAQRAETLGDREFSAFHRIREAWLRQQCQQWPEAEQAAETGLLLAREVEKPELEMLAHGVLGAISKARAENANALSHYEQILAIAQRTGDARKEAAAAGELASLHHQLGENGRAREFAERQLSLARQTSNRNAEFAALSTLGGVDLDFGEHGKAEERCTEAAAIAAEIGDRRGEAKALDNLGVLRAPLGDHARALEFLERGLAVAHEEGALELEAKLLGSLGGVHWSTGQFARAREALEGSIDLARQIGDRKMEADSLANLAVVLLEVGELPRALELLERHLAFAQDSGDRKGEVFDHTNMGLVLRLLGEPRKAVEHDEAALTIAREESIALANIGTALAALGDWVGAKKSLEQSLTIAQECGAREAGISALSSLGALYASLGDFQNAKECFERGFTWAVESELYEWIVTGLLDLGSLSSERGELREAEERLERAILLSRQANLAWKEWRSLADLAEVHDRLGDPARAEQRAEEALALQRRMGIEGDRISTLSHLASLAIGRSDLDSTRAHLEEAEEMLRRPAMRSLETEAASAARGRFPHLGEIAQDLADASVRAAGEDAAARTRAVAEGFAREGYWKSRSLLEGIVEHRKGGRTSEATRLRTEWKKTLAQREAVLSRVSRAVREDAADSAIEPLRVEAAAFLENARNLEAKIRQVSPRDATVDLPMGSRPEDVLGVLEEGTVCVDFAEGAEFLYAYVLAGGDTAFLNLGDKGTIAGDAEEFITYLDAPDLEDSAAELSTSGRQLFERLLVPALRAAGGRVERLVISPTPALAGLPFEALVAGGEGAPRSFADVEFVLDRYEVAYVPSSPVLVELASTGPRKEPGRVLALADPVYPLERDPGPGGGEAFVASARLRSAPEPERLVRLEKTRNEALALAGILAPRGAAEGMADLARGRSGSLSSGILDLHLGVEASRRRLEGDLKG